MRKQPVNQKKRPKSERSRPTRPPIPRITEFTVEGYKSLRDEQKIRIGSLTILAGANSSGKSSAIQPVLLLKQTIEESRGETNLALQGRYIRFTAKDQLLSKTFGEKQDSQKSLKIGVATDNGYRLTQSYASINGKPLAVSETRYVISRLEELFDVSLRSDMTEEQIQRAMPSLYRDILEKHLKSEKLHYEVKPIGAFLNAFISADAPTDVATNSEARISPLFIDFGRPVVDAINGIIHVPGLRALPVREYPMVPRDGKRFVGPMDLYVASFLREWEELRSTSLQEISELLNRLGLTSRIATEVIDESKVNIVVSRSLEPTSDSDMVSIFDVGFGVSQVVPVLMALLIAEPNQMVYIEQPETHLHPKAQVILADIICETVERGVQVVVETHSELMLIRLQTAVAARKIDPESVVLHWSIRDRCTGFTTIKTNVLDSTGAYGDWPEDFSTVSMKTHMAYLQSSESHD